MQKSNLVIQKPDDELEIILSEEGAASIIPITFAIYLCIAFERQDLNGDWIYEFKSWSEVDEIVNYIHPNLFIQHYKKDL